MPVRRAIADDVTAILPMVGSICAYHAGLDPVRYDFLPDVVDRYARWLPARASDPRSLLLVAEDLRPVGFLVATIEANIPVYRTGEFAYIHDVWVEPEHRGRGHARGMVAEAVGGSEMLELPKSGWRRPGRMRRRGGYLNRAGFV